MTRAINLSKLTRQSSVKGTQVFMSPEALRVPPRYTEKLDVFSFGNCIATTLTHEWPNPAHPIIYEGNQQQMLNELERRHHQIDLMSSGEKDMFLPLIKKCLEGDAALRPSSVELVSAMKQIESTLQSTESSAYSQAQQAMSQLSLAHQQKTQLQQQLEEECQKHQIQLTQMQQENTQLQQDNTQLQQENTQLVEANAKLHDDIARLTGLIIRLQPNSIQPLTEPLLSNKQHQQQQEEKQNKTDLKEAITPVS